MRLFTRKRLGNQKYYYSINLSTLMVERCIETTYLESAFRDIMEQINAYWSGKTIAMPKIGAGLAGGNWDKILKIIKHHSKDINVVIYEL